jgi:Flp pilus assembly protein TadB
MEDNSSRIDVLLKMYDEHAQQARQHETQRERMSWIILAVSGVLVTFIANNGLQPNSLIASATLIVLGVYGWLFSLKHYEKNRLHTKIMKSFRDNLGGETGLDIDAIRAVGSNSHKDDYKKSPIKSWIWKCRLNHLWAGLPLLIAVLGLALSVIIVAS